MQDSSFLLTGRALLEGHQLAGGLVVSVLRAAVAFLQPLALLRNILGKTWRGSRVYFQTFPAQACTACLPRRAQRAVHARNLSCMSLEIKLRWALLARSRRRRPPATCWRSCWHMGGRSPRSRTAERGCTTPQRQCPAATAKSLSETAPGNVGCEL